MQATEAHLQDRVKEAAMADWTLVLANKNYSSWSARALLVLAEAGVAFEEVVIPLDRPETAEAIARHSPSGLLPVLKHGDSAIWDSLAITEYVAEHCPAAGVWPEDAAARAVARSVAAEMHAGFRELRAHMPMNVRASKPGRGRTADVEADIRRVTGIWRDCRQHWGSDGLFLFGRWCAADAFFAPVVSRFRTYDVELDDVCRSYAQAVLARPSVVAWFAAADAEPWAIDKYDTV